MSTSPEEIYGLRFENVWSVKDQKLLDEIVEAWSKVGAIPPSQSSMDRAKQVVFLIRDREDQIVGISTAYIAMVPQLKNYLFIYRCMIFPGHEIPGLFTRLTQLTLDYLESIHKSLKSKVIGVFTEMENKVLHKLDLAVLPTGFVFIGFSKRGNPIRVYYFKGAKI